MNSAYPPSQYQEPEYELTPAAKLEYENERRVAQGKRPLTILKENLMKTHRVILKSPGAVRPNACGHRIDPRNHPRFPNCQDCWNVYFMFNEAETKAMARLAEAFGSLAVKNQKGKKFYRAFVAYCESRTQEAAATFENSIKLEPETPAENPEAPEPLTVEQQEEFGKSLESVA